MARTSLLLTFLLAVLHLDAQVNETGTFHLSAGVAFGLHGTVYEEVVEQAGVPLKNKETDGAITVTVPVDVQFGVAKPLSIGAYVEPGMYLDSNATRSNALFIAGVKPRLYIVQNDDFAWMLDARFGMNFLNIDDLNDLGLQSSANYSGPHFGLGTGFGSYFGIVGFNIGLSWQRNSFSLQNLNIDNTDVDDIEAELDTEGIQLNAQLAVHF